MLAYTSAFKQVCSILFIIIMFCLLFGRQHVEYKRDITGDNTDHSGTGQSATADVLGIFSRGTCKHSVWQQSDSSEEI